MRRYRQKYTGSYGKTMGGTDIFDFEVQGGVLTYHI